MLITIKQRFPDHVIRFLQLVCMLRWEHVSLPAACCARLSPRDLHVITRTTCRQSRIEQDTAGSQEPSWRRVCSIAGRERESSVDNKDGHVTCYSCRHNCVLVTWSWSLWRMQGVSRHWNVAVVAVIFHHFLPSEEIVIYCHHTIIVPRSPSLWSLHLVYIDQNIWSNECANIWTP